MVRYLVAHENEVYPALAAKGEALRRGVEKVFADRGILARCTGDGNGVISGSSMASLYFPFQADRVATSADEMQDTSFCDVALRERALKLGLLLEDVNVMHGLGAVSMSHTDDDLARVFEAFDAFAVRLKNA